MIRDTDGRVLCPKAIQKGDGGQGRGGEVVECADVEIGLVLAGNAIVIDKSLALLLG